MHRMTHWYLFDCGLAGAYGHHYNNAVLLAEELARRSCSLDIYAHKSCQIDIPFARLASHFRHFFYARVPRNLVSSEAEEFLLLRRMFLEDLLRINRSQFHSTDIVIFPTFGHSELPAILQWADTFSESAPFKTIIIQYYQPFEWASSRLSCPSTSHYRWAWDKMLTPRLAARLAFCTTTSALATQYLEVLGTAAHVLPWLKYHAVKQSSATGAGPDALTRGKVVAAYVGGGRAQKGYHLLPAIVERCVDIPELHFSIQRSHIRSAELAAVDTALENNNRVRFIKGTLDRDHYLSIISDADLVLLLNDPDRGYRNQLSGVYAEAALAGTAVIAHKDTWVGGQVKVNGNGVLFEQYTAESVRIALRKAMTDIGSLSARAAALAQDLRPRHGPQKVVDFLQECSSVANTS
jgi:hypothetical protein